MRRSVAPHLDEFEGRDLPSQAGTGFLSTLPPTARTAVRELRQIANVAVLEVQQISGLLAQEIQQLDQSAVHELRHLSSPTNREVRQVAQSAIWHIDQITQSALQASQAADPAQTGAPGSLGGTAASPSPAADPAAKTSGGSAGVSSTTTRGKSGYIYYRYGNQSAPTSPPTPVPGLALEGGGTDIDLLYQWMGARADGVDATVNDNTLDVPNKPTSEGDFLVLGTAKDSAYDSYIYNLNLTSGTPLNSVSTLDIPSTTAANDPFVAQTIARASAIFIMGGNQATYVNNWQGTAVQTALDQAAARGVPIGGTSAGLAVLGQYSYTDESGSDAISSTVLANPYNANISLDQGFLSVPSVSSSQPIPAQSALPYLENTITDTHLFERDRMGRLVTFLARLVEDPRWTPPSPPGGPTPLPGTMGIGIDESTALLIDTTGPTAGDATVIGNSATNHLYFLDTSGVAPDLVGTTNTLAAPLTWGTSSPPALQVHRATVGDNLSFNQTTHTWQPVGTESTLSGDYTLWVTGGTLTSSTGSIY
jgi:cyanophycinase-like exopeptidase